jgi:hypothetical protein
MSLPEDDPGLAQRKARKILDAVSAVFTSAEGFSGTASSSSKAGTAEGFDGVHEIFDRFEAVVHAGSDGKSSNKSDKSADMPAEMPAESSNKSDKSDKSADMPAESSNKIDLSDEVLPMLRSLLKRPAAALRPDRAKAPKSEGGEKQVDECGPEDELKLPKVSKNDELLFKTAVKYVAALSNEEKCRLAKHLKFIDRRLTSSSSCSGTEVAWFALDNIMKAVGGTLEHQWSCEMIFPTFN